MKANVNGFVSDLFQCRYFEERRTKFSNVVLVLCLILRQ